MTSSEYKPSPVHQQAHGNGIFSLHVTDSGTGNALSAPLVGALDAALEHLRREESLKVLILAGTDQCFLSGGRDATDGMIRAGLHLAIAEFPCPVIAVLEGGASGAGFLAAALCDFMICSEASRYRFAGHEDGFVPSAAEQGLFAQRFGARRAAEFLAGDGPFTGSRLRDMGWTCPIVPAGQAWAHALELAGELAAKPQPGLRLLKQHLARGLVALARALPAAAPDAPDAQAAGEGEYDPLEALGAAPATVAATGKRRETRIALASTVVSATVDADGIVVVSMADRTSKNMFSQAFIAGMREVFDHIDAEPGYKVVVLTGYGNYFAAGGTRDALLDIQAGRARFTDDLTYQLALACRLPVVAAMQGHGIGGGLSLGLFADVAVFGEESRYCCPYMNYGFTPGAGATLAVPHRMGYDLAREALLTGREYSGSELARRGLGHPVHPRKQVLTAAIALARRIAAQPRDVLIERKREASRRLREALPAHIALELAMHEQTFVGQEAALDRIQSVFDPMNGASEAPAPRPAARSPQLADIVATLRTLLAQELHMNEGDIDQDAQFVDLGLDSITGVTWMRRINAEYKTDIAAIKVYSYPTLAQLASHLAQQLPAVADEAAAGNPAGCKGECAAPQRPAAAPRVALSAPQAASDAPLPAPAAAAAAVATIRRLLAHELHMDEQDIDEDAQFVDLGLDSITGVTLVRRINQAYGAGIAAITLYSHPTVKRLAAYVEREAGKRAAAAPEVRVAAPSATPIPRAAGLARPKLVSWRGQKPSRTAAAPGPRSRAEPVAVIGMAGQFPQARNVDEFWRNIAAGRDCVAEVPPQRWDVADFYRPGEPAAGKTNSRWLGALDDYDAFDPLFFNISPGEAACMDPQQRLFLEACWHSIEHAGYNPRALSGTRCGVFAGCGYGEYQLLSEDLRLSAQGFTGGAPSILAARIAYFLNLQGPNIAIDTACSSSLVAIASACDSLNAGASDLALAGGVYVMAGPEMHIKTAQAGMLSADGRCHTFDQDANGFVPGEAVGVVLLKRLADAQRDGDSILGVIEGWGVNQDGKTNGITAPNPESQTRLQQDVYDRFGIDPFEIRLVEAHGTGTKLGDPIEVAALKEAFGKYTRQEQYCALGSVKSNIGHCLQAAGIAGFIKLLLALRQRQLPPTIHFNRLNEHIDLRGSPFYVNRELRDWAAPSGVRRHAAISSFGFSGTNAHIVVGEAPAAGARRLPVSGLRQDGRVAVPLSARSPEQLRQLAQALLEHIGNAAPGTDLLDLAYTLQVGREAMDERMVVLAASMDELARKLQAYLAGAAPVAELWQGQVRLHREAMTLISQDPDTRETLVQSWLGRGQLAKLAEMWVKGLHFDWNRLYGEHKPRRIALPTYPFARERYWIEAGRGGAAQGGPAALHPLLHRNTSDLYQHGYSSTFSGQEPFLADHRIRTETGTWPVLPGVAYLEMARAALAQALPDLEHPGDIELRDIVWLQPLLVPAATQVTIALSGDDAGAEPGQQVEFAVRSRQGGAELIHCEGRAQRSAASAPQRLDVAAMRARMHGDILDAPALYPMFAAMGLHYGPAHQGVTAIRMGESELLAELRLPDVLAHERQAFVLAPSLADSALQASVGLVFDLDRLPGRPAVPFALASIRMLAPCVPSMFAWVRHATGSQAGDAVVKLDLDLCDASGAVYVQMRGFAARMMDKAGAGDAEPAGGKHDESFYQGVIDAVLAGDVSVDDAAELG